MITNFTLRRFKCFLEQDVRFGRLTLLAGGNATGKSTTIQALLLLRQAFLSGHLQKGELPLSGTLTTVGTARDALNHDSSVDSIGFSLNGSHSDERFNCSFAIEPDQFDRYMLFGDPVYESTSNLFSFPFTYLQAERWGPRLLYPMSEQSEDEMHVGTQGEFTAHVLAEFGERTVINTGLIHPESQYDSLKNQLLLWMQTIVPNLDVEVEAIEQADSVRVGLKNRTSLSSNFVRPTNTGFGISYTMPIVVAALMAIPNSLLIVENPEAHLHPSAQSAMGQFLTRTAATGVQVIIETHSDHILNGIRLAVHQQFIKPTDISIQFFTHGEKQRVISPKIDKNGRIDREPSGFFDQLEKDLMALL